MDPEITNWRKSSRSDADGNCVEVGTSTDGKSIGIRDSKNREGGMLLPSRPAWEAFIEGVRQGKFNI